MESKMAAGMQLPSFRSLQDVLTDAQFTIPTLNDPERMSNRMVHNLLYYQTNYFLCYIVIFLVVGTLYPKDMIIGAVSVTVALVVYAKICKEKENIKQAGNIIPVAVVAIVLLLLYMLGSVLVFLWGVVTPTAVILLHATCRTRNLRNKFTNITEIFRENPSPMAVILSAICNEQDRATAVRMNRIK